MLKQKNYRNRKLLDLARKSPCCMGSSRPNDGTVVAAHANSQTWGKGAGLKAHDFAIAFLDYESHIWLDSSDASKEDKAAFWLRAHVKTMVYLFENHITIK